MKTVIFDMDGLMFDTERVFVDAWNYAGEKIGIGQAGFMIMRSLGLNNDMVRKVWREEFGDDYDHDALDRCTNEFLDDYYAKNGVPVKKGLYNLLEYLSENGYITAVASSTKTADVIKRLESTGTDKYFSAVIGGDKVKKSKPEPDIYLAACKAIGAEPAKAYALEDSRNGLIAAHKAGLKPIMIPDLWQSDAEFDKILFAKLKDLDEAKELFKKIDSGN